MDDRFLSEQRRDPPAGYARALRERLRELEDVPEPRGFRLHPALVSAFGVAAIAIAFTFPAVRVAAQNALDLFRVRSFAAVEIQEDRLQQLKKLGDEMNKNGDPETMLFAQHEVLQDPGPPVDYPSADLASSAAGLPGIEKPGPLPAGLALEKAVHQKPGAVRLQVRTDQLRSILQSLGITDVQVPSGFDGQSITVNMPASVTQVYKSGDKMLTVMEANTPEVTLPPGADLQRLGEVGLRILGLDASEASRLAAKIDWKNTMLVPVPTTAAAFREVEVNGNRGLMIDARGERLADGKRSPRRTVVMWAEGERVHAVAGTIDPKEVLDVAQNLR